MSYLRALSLAELLATRAGFLMEGERPAGLLPLLLESEHGSVMIEDMSTVRITETELARDVHAVLERVRQGVEIVIEEDHRPVAVIRSPLPRGRLLSECIALAEARGTTAILDEGFVKDVEEGIAERSKPWNPPAWESSSIRAS